MRPVLRALAALNGAFQLLLGLLCVARPVVAASIFQLDASGATVLALIRMFGGLLAGGGLLSLALARDPDRNPQLAALVAATSLTNVAADAVVVSRGELGAAQLGGGMVIQVLLAAAAIAYSLSLPRDRKSVTESR